MKKSTLSFVKGFFYGVMIVTFIINYCIAQGFITEFWGHNVISYKPICNVTYITIGIILIITMSIELFRGLFKK